MDDPDRKGERAEFAEEAESLWRIAFGPAVWAAHFTLSYAATAIWCAKAGGEMGGFRVAVGGGGVVALALLAWLGRSAWRQWDWPDDHDDVHDGGRAEDRHEFLGHAAFLLVIVSAVGVIYTTLPVLVLETCR